MTALVEELQQALGPAYRIERELGGGGMSRVFVAEEPALGRRVAVKLLPPDLSNGVTAERFRREIHLAARLQHPHIVPLLSAEQARGLAFYVMPYVAGETLRERLTREGALSPTAAIAIARDVAEALDYAHGQGVVHRDIKPENILLASGHALVLDFGVAKALREAGAQESGTTAGVALGTPQYMSPEQAAGGADVDGRADLYALGVVLYEMLAGRPPFESTSAYEVMGAHIADTPPRLRRRSRETSAALEAVVSRCLAKRPADRYQTASELEADLERVGTASGPPRGRGLVVRYAAGAIAVLATVLLGLRATTVLGPRTLVAAGILTEREPVILADFENRTPDSTLGVLITEALRIDLAQSPAVAVVPPARISSALARMRRPESRLDLTASREVAEREGVRAIVSGEIAAVGSAYVIWATIVHAGTGEVLAGFREKAVDEAGIIRAVDRVSKQLRARIGESVWQLEDAAPLDRVTTPSLDALRAYSRGVRALHAGDHDRAAASLEDAVRLDSAFASAYRRLAVAYSNWGVNRQRQLEALLEAYRLRDRLPADESDLVTASYYQDVDHQPDRSIAAYEAVLERRPDDAAALNNLALLHVSHARPEQALKLYRRNAEANPGVRTLTNLFEAEFNDGHRDAADSLLGVMQQWDSAAALTEFLRAGMSAAEGRYDSAEAGYHRLAERHGEGAGWRFEAYLGLASTSRVRGRLAEAEKYDRAAINAGTAYESSGALREIQLALVAAGTEIQLLGKTEAGLRRVQAALRNPALQAIPPLDRPYLDAAYYYAIAGRADLARAVLVERRVVLNRAGPAGQAALLTDRHDERFLIVQARALVASGAPDSAVALLRNATLPGYETWLLPHFGDAYDAAGRPDSATAAYERFLGRRILEREDVDGWHRPRILFRLGEIYEGRGEPGRAAMYYSAFADLWRGADPVLQPRVADARRRLAALTAEPGRP